VARFAFVFPGQGSQFVGMGADIIADFKAARLVFEEAEDELHMKLRSLVMEGPADELARTENTQPAILVMSEAIIVRPLPRDTAWVNTPRWSPPGRCR
jgi:[acyl-carrier-protein] S-malonyltransferase